MDKRSCGFFSRSVALSHCALPRKQQPNKETVDRARVWSFIENHWFEIDIPKKIKIIFHFIETDTNAVLYPNQDIFSIENIYSFHNNCRTTTVKISFCLSSTLLVNVLLIAKAQNDAHVITDRGKIPRRKANE